MATDPATGGRKPPVISVSFDLLKLPFIGPLLRMLLGGGIGGTDKDLAKAKDKKEESWKRKN